MGRLRIDPIAFSWVAFQDVAPQSAISGLPPELIEYYQKDFERVMQAPIEVVPNTNVPIDNTPFGRALSEVMNGVLSFRYWNNIGDLSIKVGQSVNFYFRDIVSHNRVLSVNPKGVFVAHPDDYFKYVHNRHPEDIALAKPEYGVPRFGTKLAGINFLDELPKGVRAANILQSMLRL